ncbi:hypothetical protein NECAME_02652 [Necator americanus]|uniref:Uncharacterized protein n=1 Tax=Necator americanus TaxID=51031 RepID=W2TDG1_NECAM|nr:hypothetical protein NECAME_02652 [Necator americanus]ETN79226.1 hypothetical protein NECAME_02652 [Necator americanus]
MARAFIDSHHCFLTASDAMDVSEVFDGAVSEMEIREHPIVTGTITIDRIAGLFKFSKLKNGINAALLIVLKQITDDPKVERVEKVIVERRPDSTAIHQLQNQLDELKRQNKDLLQAEQAARKRLEANQDALQRRIISSDNGIRARDYDELRRQISSVDGKMMSLNNDINGLRSAMDRQMNDLLHINNEMKSRPVIDPSKIANSTQQMDGKVRDLHSQVMLLKQTLDTERNERVKEGNAFNSTLQRLQDFIKQQDATRTEVLNNLSRKGDIDKEKMTEEAKRLNEKIGLITAEVTRNTTEAQRKLRDDLFQRCAALEAALKAQSDKSGDVHRDTKRAIEERLRSQEEQTENLNKQLQKSKQGLSHDRREISQQIANLDDSDDVAKLKDQLNRLGGVHGDMEKTQERIRDKVEKQIPKDLNELSAKADNIRHQLNARIDKEEEERFLAIKELQEAFQKLQSRSSSFPNNDPLGPGSSAQIRRDLDECKVAIKKLAESVTTVKNVLDRKITDESKKNDIGGLKALGFYALTSQEKDNYNKKRKCGEVMYLGIRYSTEKKPERSKITNKCHNKLVALRQTNKSAASLFAEVRRDNEESFSKLTL